MPRNDRLALLGENEIKKGESRKADFGLDPETKILLYAPTLRQIQGSRTEDTKLDVAVDLQDTLNHLQRRGDSWVCFVRAHPKSGGLNIQCDNKVFYDMSVYPDMSDLMEEADMLITDYSSSAGDFILKKKAVILAQFDRELYRKQFRDFYFDIDESGFLIAKNQGELNHIIDTMADEDYAENCQRIMDFFGTHETGHAAEEVCRRIAAWCGEGHILRA